MNNAANTATETNRFATWADHELTFRIAEAKCRDKADETTAGQMAELVARHGNDARWMVDDEVLDYIADQRAAYGLPA
jgi:hypothetical protein